MPDRAKLEQMLAASPDDLFLKYALAMSCASDGDEEEATERLASINREHPDYVAAWFQRGQILSRLGESDEAREVILSGIDVAQRTGDAHAEGEMRAFLDLL